MRGAPQFYVSTNQMIIRRLLPSDASLFHQLRLESLQESPSAFGSSYEEEISHSLSSIEARLSISIYRGVFGAFDGTKLVGLIGLGRENLQNLSDKMFVWGMYVTPIYRGASIGKALLTTALSFARTVPNVRQVNLCVNATNDSAIRLYEAFGFSTFGREPQAMLINGVLYDEIHMRKGVRPLLCSNRILKLLSGYIACPRHNMRWASRPKRSGRTTMAAILCDKL